MEEEPCVHCYEDLLKHHHRNLRCPGGRRTIYKALPESVYWNPYNKVVQDHRDGTIFEEATNAARALRGLPTPWVAALGDVEVKEAPVY